MNVEQQVNATNETMFHAPCCEIRTKINKRYPRICTSKTEGLVIRDNAWCYGMDA